MAGTAERLTIEEARESWRLLSNKERAEAFGLLAPEDAREFFTQLAPARQAQLVALLPAESAAALLRRLPPGRIVDVIQASPRAARTGLLDLFVEPLRGELVALLAYKEDVAGGLMNPRYCRVHPEMTVGEAVVYIRQQSLDEHVPLSAVYVIDRDERLVGVFSLRYLFSARDDERISRIMKTDFVSVTEHMDQEEVSQLFRRHHLAMVPVLGDDGRIKGVVTAEDIVRVVEKEATEDIHKMGGMESLDEPYFLITLPRMIKKRAGWLLALFLGEMLTASAMSYFEDEIARAVVLALFLPLIISSGGNSGSQATTLVIRAMALGQIRLRDWWRVIRREFIAGLSLGLVLGLVGVIRILLWQSVFHLYGAHYFLVALTVGLSLVGVVLWGTIAGSMLPFILRRLGADPASASAPFVATLVDVTGLIIYFTTASVILHGAML